MGKIQYVKKARKEHKCSKCGNIIKAGEPYKKGVINFHPDIVVCDKCPLKSYEVTTSDYCKQIGAICEDWIEEYGNTETTASEIATVLEELRDEVESNLDNMPDNLRENSPTGEMLQQRLDELEDAIDALNDIDAEDIRATAREEAENDHDEDDYETHSEWEEAVEQEEEELFENKLSEAIEDAISSLSY